MKKIVLCLALVLALNAVAPVTGFFADEVYARHTNPEDDRDRGGD